jgi:hypothetical protein
VRAVMWAAPVQITPSPSNEIPWTAVIVTVAAFMVAGDANRSWLEAVHSRCIGHIQDECV